MNKYIKAIMVFCLYKIKFAESYKDNWIKNERNIIWRYEMHPRYIPILLLTIILTPIAIFLYGFKEYLESLKDVFKINSSSSMNLHLKEGEKPTKWMAYNNNLR